MHTSNVVKSSVMKGEPYEIQACVPGCGCNGFGTLKTNGSLDPTVVVGTLDAKFDVCFVCCSH